MRKFDCSVALLCALAALASCGGGNDGVAIGLPAGVSSMPSASNQKPDIDVPSYAPPETNKPAFESPGSVQGLTAVLADSRGVIDSLERDYQINRARSITSTGAVSEIFIPGGNPIRYLGSASTAYGGRPERYLLSAAGPDTLKTQILFETLARSEQAANGAMKRLNNFALVDRNATHDIHGDRSFALGSWVSGAVTNDTGSTDVLSGGLAYHYLAFNEIPNIPRNGTPPFTCDSGAFTTPTYLDSGPNDSALHGTVTGSATVSFTDNDAVVRGSITVRANGGEGTVPLRFGFNAPSSTGQAFSTDDRAGRWSVALMLGDGNDYRSMMIAVRYIAVMLPSRARYIGVAKLTCNPTS